MEAKSYTKVVYKKDFDELSEVINERKKTFIIDGKSHRNN